MTKEQIKEIKSLVEKVQKLSGRKVVFQEKEEKKDFKADLMTEFKKVGQKFAKNVSKKQFVEAMDAFRKALITAEPKKDIKKK